MGYVELGDAFDQMKVQRLRHQLVGHPLMTAQSIADLALRIDPDYVRFHDGERSVATNMTSLLRTDPTRDGLRKAIGNLHKTRAFVQLINIRSDPAYRALLDELHAELLPFLPARDRALINRDASAFLASPRSVTPFHLDHEQNFLCHLSGPKTFYVWDHRDRSVISERALETFYHIGKLRDAIYQPDVEPRAQVFELQPGDCIYMPMGSPHAAVTGDDITATFSLLMNTRSSYDMVETYRVNHVLRRIGLSPRPVGTSPSTDSFKAHTVEAARTVRDLARFRRHERRLQWY
jgi:hypothetical protein